MSESLRKQFWQSTIYKRELVTSRIISRFTTVVLAFLLQVLQLLVYLPLLCFTWSGSTRIYLSQRQLVLLMERCPMHQFAPTLVTFKMMMHFCVHPYPVCLPCEWQMWGIKFLVSKSNTQYIPSNRLAFCISFHCSWLNSLTHWGRVTHRCVSKLTVIGSYNGLSPGRRQAIIWTNAGILFIGTLGTNFNENLFEIRKFSYNKIWKCRPRNSLHFVSAWVNQLMRFLYHYSSGLFYLSG